LKRAVPTLLACAGALAVPVAAQAAADPPQPALDRGVLKSLYQPAGFFKPGDAIPSTPVPPAPTDATGVYNPSGHWSAYDTDLFESLSFPGRQAGDTTNNDAPGSGDPRYGYCPPAPNYMPQGRCANHALEYLDYYEATMKAILKDFGGAVQRYKFVNPGRSDVNNAAGEPAGLSSPGGETFNIAGIVPGADHPEQEVIVSGHWDFTDAAHAAAWDSAEGHAEVIRMAKIMTDYWRATGTRPAVTVKFMPWAAEESGTYGSLDYVNNYVAGEEDQGRIRGYFNVDPCAGAFPAFYHGNPAQQVPMVMQVTDPATAQDPEKAKAFNAGAERVIDEFFADIDDTVDTLAGPLQVFADADRAKIVTAVGGLAAFSSDYRNFEAIGVPIMNLFPDMFGPHADGTPASGEGAATIHTPRDSMQTLNALTSADQSGLTASDGWMTGMELCSQLESRYMLQPEMGGAQISNLDPVAFMEVFQPKAKTGKAVVFSASGSYQYGQLATRQLVADADLQFKWDFGDGSAAAFGKSVRHTYKLAKDDPYKVTLTVTNRDSRKADTATRRVLVEKCEESCSNDADPDQSADPGMRAQNSVVACQSGTGFSSLSVTPAGKGLRVDAAAPNGNSFLAEVFQAAKGRKAATPKKLASFSGAGSATWDGKLKKGALSKGTYFVRVSTRGTGPRPDVRGFGLDRKGAKFKARKPFQRADSCELLSLVRLDAPAFGGKRPLSVNFTTTKAARVTVSVFRGNAKKALRKFTKTTSPNRLARVKVAPRKLKAGEYRIVVSAAGGGGKQSAALYAVKY
jgi:hypothetical protein